MTIRSNPVAVPTGGGTSISLENGNESERTIRVLHCINSLAGGGAERQMRLLASAPPSSRLRSTVFCINNAGVGAHECPFPVIVNKKSGIAVFRGVWMAIREIDPDIVHAWLPASMTIPAMVIGTCAGRPVVFSFRNEMRLRRTIKCFEYIAAFTVADAVVSNTRPERCAPIFRYLYRAKGGVYIPNAVDVGQLPARPHRVRSDQPTRERPLRLLFAGRLSQQKNWRCMILAMHLLKEKVPYKLTVCGDGEDRGDLDRLVAELGLLDVVTPLGYRTDVLEIMTQADLFLLPSWYEGMPNVLLEALVLGLPCIASNIPAVRDLVGNRRCVLTFDPASPADLARLILQVAEQPDVMLDLQRNASGLATEYSVERMHAAYRDFYAHLIEREGAPVKKSVTGG
jgi:glycosyltransferase involved in cell wall biosynthesis